MYVRDSIMNLDFSADDLKKELEKVGQYPDYHSKYLLKKDECKGKISINEVIGLIISNYRKSKNMKLKDLASLLGLTNSSISKVEKGQTALTLENFINILSFLDINLDIFKKYLQMCIYILVVNEKIYVYSANDLKQKYSSSDNILENKKMESIKGLNIFSKILGVNILFDNFGFGKSLSNELNKLKNITENNELLTEIEKKILEEIKMFNLYSYIRGELNMLNKKAVQLHIFCSEIDKKIKELERLDNQDKKTIRDLEMKKNELKEKCDKNDYEIFLLEQELYSYAKHEDFYVEAGLSDRYYIY